MAYEKTDMNNRKTKKRNDLIKAAIKTFAQKGFHGTKISDIAKKQKWLMEQSICILKTKMTY